MKKKLLVLLCFVMILSMTVPVLAATYTSTGGVSSETATPKKKSKKKLKKRLKKKYSLKWHGNVPEDVTGNCLRGKPY